MFLYKIGEKKKNEWVCGVCVCVCVRMCMCLVKPNLPSKSTPKSNLGRYR